MRRLKYLLAILLMLTISGCNEVFTARPIGEKPIELKAEDWNGTWFNSEGDSCSLKVVDEKNGMLEIAQLGWEGKEAKVFTMELQLREWGNCVFATAISSSPENSGPRDKSKGGYLWARIKRDGNVLIFWQPDVDKFTSLVKNGKLPGKVNDSKDKTSKSVDLGELTPEHVKIFASDVYDWDNPLILMRIANPQKDR